MSNLTGALAMDCEMIGATKKKGSTSVAARVSLVDENGACVYDTYIKPNSKVTVTDYRTAVSGITPEKLEQGKPFNAVKGEVAHYIKRRILVGHSVNKDLRALHLCHPERNIRDIAKLYQTESQGIETPSLKDLTQKYLGLTIQNGPHDSVQDAVATMQLYNQLLINRYRTAIEKFKAQNK